MREDLQLSDKLRVFDLALVRVAPDVLESRSYFDSDHLKKLNKRLFLEGKACGKALRKQKPLISPI